MYGPTIKMLVKEDRGFKLWGSVPKSILQSVQSSQMLVGKHVAFSATVEPSKSDSKFGVFSRPTKAEIWKMPRPKLR